MARIIKNLFNQEITAMRRKNSWLSLVGILVFLPLALTPLKAKPDFFWQPPSENEFREEWRATSSDFLLAIAKITELLSLLEGGDVEGAIAFRPEVLRNIDQAISGFGALSANLEEGGLIGSSVSLEDVEAGSRSRVEQIFQRYEMLIPDDVGEIVSTALEVLRELRELVQNELPVSLEDEEDFRGLLRAVGQTIELGDAASLLLGTAEGFERSGD